MQVPESTIQTDDTESMNHRCLTATFNLRDSTISYCELPITVHSDDGVIVLDGDEEVFVDELDCEGSDCVLEVYEAGDSLDEIKADLEERIRLRMAHANLVHPNIPLKEASHTK